MIKDLAKTITLHCDVSELFVHAAEPLAKVAFNRDFLRLWDHFRLFGKVACLNEMRQLAVAGA